MDNNLHAVRVVIADEQPVFRHGLRGLLESEHGLNVLGEASDAPGTVKLARQLKPDILLMDLALPRRLGLQGPTNFATCLAPVRTLVMLATIDKANIVEAFRLGAHGIVLKTSPSPALLQSIRSVMAGRYWLESESVSILVEALRDLVSQGNGATSLKEYGLTPRELDIIAKIASGHSNKEVGEGFSISERTVKHHLTNIFSKVGVSSRLQLALFAVNHHLMSDQPPSLALEPLQSDGEVQNRPSSRRSTHKGLFAERAVGT
jgi:two-component system, NarL family, nitrate/nitrite response regulator NarL